MNINLPPRDALPDLGPVGARVPIVPDTGSSRWTLVAVIAILAFLAAMAAGTAVLVATASAQWRAALADQATIQLRPTAGRDEEADLARIVEAARATPGILSAEALSRAEAERLLEPWLGTGLDLSELPVPRLVVLRLGADARAALPRLALRLKIDVPGASLDDHGAWLARLSRAATGGVALSVGIVVLVLVASAGAVAFATQGVVLSHRDVIEVLHLVGATPAFVAGLFARRFGRLGLLGGLLGCAAAAAFLAAASRLFDAGGDAGRENLLGAVTVAPSAYAAIAAIALADGAVAGCVAALMVKRFLKEAAPG